MKVDPSKIRGASTAATEGAKSTKTAAADLLKNKTDKMQTRASDDFAKVEISKKAQMANKVRELATPDLDSVDEDRVAHFQKLIDEGKYKTDAKAIADKMVDEHLIS